MGGSWQSEASRKLWQGVAVMNKRIKLICKLDQIATHNRNKEREEMEGTEFVKIDDGLWMPGIELAGAAGTIKTALSENDPEAFCD
jgi:hypothetical protein